VLMSLIASCKANKVESWAWLRDVLTRLPQGQHPEQLLPDPWLTRHPQHRCNIVDRREEERHPKAESL